MRIKIYARRGSGDADRMPSFACALLRGARCSVRCALAVGLEHVESALGHPGAPLHRELLLVEGVEHPDRDAAHKGEGKLEH